MKLFYSERHGQRDSDRELRGGDFVMPFESPERMFEILDAWRQRFPDTPTEPELHDRAPILRIHDSQYVDFLKHCWRDWQAYELEGEAIATCWPSRRLPRTEVPTHIKGRIGYYCMAADTSINEGTWEGALAAVDVTLSAQEYVAQTHAPAFALCRPPGHHAAIDMFGGYCFLNNAAIAAQAWLDGGAQRIAILDVDVHHGNGTQQIFYDRADVLFISIHGDPKYAFPYFLGGADEVGIGAGEGFNCNYPLPLGTEFGPWQAALTDALDKITNYSPDAVVISLGVDTYRDDPLSLFELQSEDFLRIGAQIKILQRPTLFVLEGGYLPGAIGTNVCNVCEGFEHA